MSWIRSFCLCLALATLPAQAASGVSPAARLLAQGMTFEKKGDYPSAIACCTQAISLSPRYDRAWLFRAGLKIKENDLRGALTDLGQVLSFEPDSVGALRLRSSIEAEQGDLAAANADRARVARLEHTRPAGPVKEATCEISSASIRLNEMAVVTLRVTNSDSEIEHYLVPHGLKLYAETATTTNTMKAGFLERETVYQYTLQPLGTGDFVIPAFSIPQKSGLIEVPEVRLKVTL